MSELAIRSTDDFLAVMGPYGTYAEKISQTDFVPKTLRGKPESVLACIMTGHEIGITPMQSLSKIHVIEGRPAMGAELMRALVLSHGHEIWTEEYTSHRVTLAGKRSGSEAVSRVTWQEADAKRANLLFKDNWKKYPRAMLLARATGELCRLMFPDVLGGISYTQEEIVDWDVLDEEPAEEPTSVTHSRQVDARPRKATSKRVAKEKPPRDQPPEPELDDDVVDGEVVPDIPEELDRNLVTRIVMLADEVKIDRHALNRFVTEGRAESTKGLTLSEAEEAINVLLGVRDNALSVQYDNGVIVAVNAIEYEEPKKSSSPPKEPDNTKITGPMIRVITRAQLKCPQLSLESVIEEVTGQLKEIDELTVDEANDVIAELKKAAA